MKGGTWPLVVEGIYTAHNPAHLRMIGADPPKNAETSVRSGAGKGGPWSLVVEGIYIAHAPARLRMIGAYLPKKAGASVR